jgi:hypothetical protein
MTALKLKPTIWLIGILTVLCACAEKPRPLETCLGELKERSSGCGVGAR